MDGGPTNHSGGSSSRGLTSGLEAHKKALGSGSRPLREDRLQITSGFAKSVSELGTVKVGGLFSGFQAQMVRKLQGQKNVRGAKAGGEHVARPAKGWSRENGWVEVATLGLIRGHAQPHHTHQVLENYLASSPGCCPWLEGWNAGAQWGLQKVEAFGPQEARVSSQHMTGGSL